MKTKVNGTVQRSRRMNHGQGDGPNWILIAGGALLSTISIRLGCKLREVFYMKQRDNAAKESRNSVTKRRHGTSEMHTNAYNFNTDAETCDHCLRGSLAGSVDSKQCQSLSPNERCTTLPIVQIQASGTSKDNGVVVWASTPPLLELPLKPFHHSNSSDSPSASESGSDIYSKREVIQKLRQQLKNRDEMVMEMQAQILELQNSVNVQIANSAHLQDQVEAANRNLFESEREIQQLRKVIADHCVAEVSPEKPSRHWPTETRNGLINGYPDSIDDVELQYAGFDKVKDGEKIEMLKSEVGDLKEVIEGKDFLIHSYKEQKVELASKVKELQLRLSSQEPNFL